ncbi:FkbM family methyltransferase [Stutzerimonas stutzeri]|uniref:FkbM family methyltransferase n=1 Tax=Stutzerimonas stutzeri TaxID=316 RepID=A0ABD4Y5M9_STUST|nr:FkbM family methyltransferase [Stutzerimonas stutzeri]MDH0690261.1 FkbM family methyltransferase [Stutzerimonas stutzeri]
MNYALNKALKSKISNLDEVMDSAYLSACKTDVLVRYRNDPKGVFRVPGSSCDINYLDIFKEVVLQDCYRLQGIRDLNPQNIFDIGANIGCFSFFSKILWPDSKIFAVEPVIENFDVLIENFSDSELFTSSLAFPAALSEKSGEGFMVMDPCNVGAAHLSAYGLPVKKISYAEMVSRSGCYPDLVKLDIEGEERNVLPELMMHIRPKAILLEWHVIQERDRSDIARPIRMLKNYGYRTNARYLPRSQTYQIEAIQKP